MCIIFTFTVLKLTSRSGRRLGKFLISLLGAKTDLLRKQILIKDKEKKEVSNFTCAQLVHLYFLLHCLLETLVCCWIYWYIDHVGMFGRSKVKFTLRYLIRTFVAVNETCKFLMFWWNVAFYGNKENMPCYFNIFMPRVLKLYCYTILKNVAKILAD